MAARPNAASLKLKSTKTAKDKVKPKDKSAIICPICDEPIIDASAKNDGQESILCESKCNSWLHRTCAGLSKAAFQIVTSSSSPFHCSHCRLDSQESDIIFLKSSVKQLVEDVQNLKHKLSSLSPDTPGISSPASYSEVTASISPNVSQTAISPSLSQPNVSQAAISQNPPVHNHQKPAIIHDRKFSLVLYNINESPTGTPWNTRAKNDFQSALSTLSTLLPSLSDQSICDCIRLGRYNPVKHRPLLVKLTRSCDVNIILSSRSSLGESTISIKPVMSKHEKFTESLLLKERKSLIESGVSRKDIKIRKNQLFLRSELHGEVSGSSLKIHNDVREVNSSASSISDTSPSLTNTSNDLTVHSLITKNPAQPIEDPPLSPPLSPPHSDPLTSS